MWGGDSRSGVDCSGLTQSVFQQLGVDIPRTTEAQYGVGTPSNGAVGDLVFGDFGSGGISHVGIAVGDGTMINAPYPGTTVRYDEIYPQYTIGYKSVV